MFTGVAGDHINVKVSSYQYEIPHYKDKIVSLMNQHRFIFVMRIHLPGKTTV